MEKYNDEVQRNAIMRLEEEAAEASSLGFGFRPRPLRDVTDAFITASNRLQPGQLIKDEYFTLFEAVGALEIMDSKMDSGYVQIHENFDLDFDINEDLSPAEMAWIMDQILCLEMSWHDGYPLSQTVFTSLHIDDLLVPENRSPYWFSSGIYHTRSDSVESQLVHKVLRAYCISVAKCCELVTQRIQQQNYYEEEDFVTHLYGRELLPGIDVDETRASLEESLEWLSGCENLDAETKDCLSGRLRFRLGYLTSLSDNDKQWQQLHHLIGYIDKTHAQTVAVPAAFSEKVQRRLASSTPPRPMLSVTWDAAMTKWRALCSDLIEVDQLTSMSICQSPHALQRATWAYAYRNPVPNAYARACLQERLFGADHLAENISHFDLFLTDIRDLVLAGDVLADPTSFQIEMPSEPRHLCSRIIEGFMDKTFDEYLNIYRMVCQNRCRMRRTFTQAIPLLDGLQTEAASCDDMIAGIIGSQTLDNVGRPIKPLATWTQYYKLQVVEWVIHLGVETQIYLIDEYAMAYWLLDNITQQRIATIHKARCLITARFESMTRAQHIRYMAECIESQDWLDCLEAHADITRLLSHSLSKLFTVLMQTGALVSPTRAYAQQDQLLYEARMKPFLCLRNAVIPTLEDFHHDQNPPMSVKTVCELVNTNMKQAKALIANLRSKTPQQAKCNGTQDQRRAELKQLEKTCVATAVQASQMLGVCVKHGKQEATAANDLVGLIQATIPQPESMYHHWWIVPQIKAQHTE